MQKEYIFRFQGTKEDFFSIFPRPPYNGSTFFLDDYIVKIVDDEVHFGVERCGHSGGNWFISKITETDGQIEFKGNLVYIGPDPEDTRTKVQKVFDKIGEILACILTLPILLIMMLYKAIEWCIRKVIKRPNKKPKNTEEKLYEMMETRLGCVRIP